MTIHLPSDPATPGSEHALSMASNDVAAAATRIGFGRRLLMSPTLPLAGVIALFVLYGTTQSAQFTNHQTWINIMREASFPMMVVVFTTMVLISGGLDLSVGSVLVAGTMTGAWVANNGHSTVLALLAAVAVGAFVGLVNGLLINYANVNAIIVTLGTLFAVRSVVTTVSDGNPIGPLPDNYAKIGQGDLLGIPYVVYYALVLSFLAYGILHLTNFGWAIRATGGNREAARAAGIDVRRLSIVVYMMNGSAAALAGAILAARLGSGSPSVGQGFELTVVAAAIIGGTSISGAIGTVPGAMLGAVLLSVLSTGLILLKVNPTLSDLVTGVVLIAAAGLDQLRRRQMFKASARSARALAKT